MININNQQKESCSTEERDQGSFLTCESAYTFTLEDQSATRGCLISPPLSVGMNDGIVHLRPLYMLKSLCVCV